MATHSDPGDRPPPFVVTVVNGDLTFERHPLLVGHYRASRLTGTEGAVDAVTGGVMSRSLEWGVYPGDPGTHQIFKNEHIDPMRTWLAPRPEAVIVVGLGQEGTLRGQQLAESVRQGVLAWALQLTGDAAKTPMTLAATLIGSGGVGVVPGQAAQLVVQGVCEAHERLWRQGGGGTGRPLVGALRIVELYLERASDAWRALKMQAAAASGRFTLIEPIAAGTGPLRRPLESGYRGADYDYIAVHASRDAPGASPASDVVIEYALDTTRARTEVRAQSAQLALVRDQIAGVGTPQPGSMIGRTLYKLLVPAELDGFLAGATETQMEVDPTTAAIPWELLDDRAARDRQRLPWAIRAKLLRKFRTGQFRERVLDADLHASVLVIGEPACPDDYEPLPGAYREAVAVHALLSQVGGLEVRGLFAAAEGGEGPDARTVVGTLLARDWRVVHITGHGEAEHATGGPGGVVLSSDDATADAPGEQRFLGPQEIKAMRQVPELVFVNCCHLGAIPADGLSVRPMGTSAPVDFAATVADALIGIGVRAIVAAGWAVEDEAASTFARTFYQALLDGDRFIDAIGRARLAAYMLPQCQDGTDDTWAAYQCYGDADWRLRRARAQGATAGGSAADEFAGVGSIEGLKLALDMLIVETTYQRREPALQIARVRALEARCREMGWGVSAGVGELFARVFAAVGDFDEAIGWYDRVVADGLSGPTFDALEQRANLRIRRAWSGVDRLVAGFDAASVPTPQDGEALARARALIETEIELLGRLSALGETAERASMMGSAYKRLSMIARAAGDGVSETAAIATMKTHYGTALTICRAQNVGGVFYPAVNLIAAELALTAAAPASPVDAALFAEAIRSLQAKDGAASDFWSVVGALDLSLFKSVGDRCLARDVSTFVGGYENLATRVQSAREWASVYDTHRFVLSRYLDHAAAEERPAARLVLDTLQRLAARTAG